MIACNTEEDLAPDLLDIIQVVLGIGERLVARIHLLDNELVAPLEISVLLQFGFAFVDVVDDTGGILGQNMIQFYSILRRNTEFIACQPSFLDLVGKALELKKISHLILVEYLQSPLVVPRRRS